MLKGLRTIVYHVNDLDAAKKWYSETFSIQPYFDEPFYVGFDVEGSELGLDPSGETYTAGNNSVTYWKVADIDAAFNKFRLLQIQIHQDVHSVGADIRLGSIFDPFGNVIGFIQEG